MRVAYWLAAVNVVLGFVFGALLGGGIRRFSDVWPLLWRHLTGIFDVTGWPETFYFLLIPPTAWICVPGALIMALAEPREVRQVGAGIVWLGFLASVAIIVLVVTYDGS